MKLKKTYIALLTLFFKTIVILTLLYLSEIIFHTYNNSYTTVKIFSIDNIWLFGVIISILLIRKRWIRITLLSVIIVIMLFEYFYFQYFETYIQPIAFFQAFTETDEIIMSFFDEFSTMVIPIFIIFALFILISTMNILKNINSYRNTILGVMVLMSIFSINLYSTYKNLHSKSGKLWQKQALQVLPLPGKHSVINFSRSLSYFLVGIMPKKIIAHQSKIFPPLQEPKIKIKNINANIIFVIGESLRAKQLHILGYPLKTTPNLEKIDNLYYDSVFSAGTMTKCSVSAILNRVKYPGSTNQMTTMKNNLFYLAKKNGFKTYFYSRQTTSQLSILSNYIGLKYIDNYASRETLQKKRKYKNIKDYDMKLKQALETIDLNQNNFIVLHMRGSHSPYHKQYPKRFNKFKLPYDNTVFYADYFLKEIIKYLKSASKKPTYFIFTSDHGELLKEHGHNGHGWFFSEVYKIPFLFYKIHENKNYITQASLENIQSHFDISNLITILLGYDLHIEHSNEIYVNGSDIDGLAGYLKIKVDENNTEQKVKRY